MCQALGDINQALGSSLRFLLNCSLRENCPNKELFLVRIFLYSDWMRIFTPQWLLFEFDPKTSFDRWPFYEYAGKMIYSIIPAGIQWLHENAAW